MASKGLAFIEEIMTFDPVERRAIAEELLLRVVDSEEDTEILRLAQERWADLEARPNAWVGHEELMTSLPH